MTSRSVFQPIHKMASITRESPVDTSASMYVFTSTLLSVSGPKESLLATEGMKINLNNKLNK